MSESKGVPRREREAIISSEQMERRLLEATRKGNIHELKDLIGSNELILEEMALKEAGHMLLHVACLGGHLDVVRELLKHMPKFAKKVDRDGFSPLHIAAARGDVEIVEELLKLGTHLCSVKGWERRIPLHNAVINGEVNVMKELLSASPESVEETTTREETALHLAVKNNRFKVLVRLVEHLKRHKKEQVINWKDHKGNTALHLAAAGKNFEVVDFLLRGHVVELEVVNVNALNNSDLMPLDVSALSQREAGDREIREILAQAGGISNSPASRPVLVDDNDVEGGNSHLSHGEPVPNAPKSLSRSTPKKLNKDGGESWRKIEALLVVAALIANATYQSVLQPPSIVGHEKVNNTSRGSENSTSSGSEKKENITYGANLVYILFLGGNTFGFLVSVQIIICLTVRFGQQYFLGPVMLSLIAMVLTYFCFTLSLLITSTGDAVDTALHVLPLMIAVFLLLIQRWLVMVLDFFLRRLFRFFGVLYGGNEDQSRGCL